MRAVRPAPGLPGGLMVLSSVVASVGVQAALELRSPGFLIAGGISALLALVAYLYANSSMKKQKRLADTETSRTGKVKPGYSEVKGKARPGGQLLQSPLSKSPCIYYQFFVEEHVQAGKSSYWRKVVDDKKDCGVFVDDGSGPVAVRLREAELFLKPDAHAKSGTFNDASPDLEATLQAYGKTTKGWVFNKTMRYTETLLRDGDELYVIGTTNRRQDGVFEFEKAGDLFIVSDESEETLSAKFNRGKIVGLVFAVLLVLGALAGVGASMAEL
jgi:hypothetical protein